MVTREESNVSATSLELLNSLINTLSESVGETYSGEKGESTLDNRTVFFVLEVVVLLELGLEVSSIEVTVSESDRLEASGLLHVHVLAIFVLSVRGYIGSNNDLVLDGLEVLLAVVVLTVESLSVVNELAGAELDDLLGGTLDVNTDDIGVVPKLVSGGHHLAV